MRRPDHFGSIDGSITGKAKDPSEVLGISGRVDKALFYVADVAFPGFRCFGRPADCTVEFIENNGKDSRETFLLYS